MHAQHERGVGDAGCETVVDCEVGAAEGGEDGGEGWLGGGEEVEVGGEGV